MRFLKKIRRVGEGGGEGGEEGFNARRFYASRFYWASFVFALALLFIRGGEDDVVHFYICCVDFNFINYVVCCILLFDSKGNARV